MIKRTLKLAAMACVLLAAVACTTTVEAAPAAPVIGAVSPAYIVVNPSGGQVALTGSGFKGNAIGLVNGQRRPLLITSTTSAIITLSTADTGQAGFLGLQIQNQKPTPASSNTVNFQVCAQLQILTTALPPATVGVWYEVQLQATGGCI